MFVCTTKGPCAFTHTPEPEVARSILDGALLVLAPPKTQRESSGLRARLNPAMAVVS